VNLKFMHRVILLLHVVVVVGLLFNLRQYAVVPALKYTVKTASFIF